MNFKGLKKHIYEKNLADVVLKELGCKHIQFHQKYYTCTNPDGDNPTAIQVFNEPQMNCNNYTRNINGGRQVDIIALCNFFRAERMAKTFAWLSNLVGYGNEEVIADEDDEYSEFLICVDTTESVVDSTYVKENVILSENILFEYRTVPNMLFVNDGISIATQEEFEIGFDLEYERITIPVRDSFGRLVGVKGRYFGKVVPSGTNKYLAIQEYKKSAVLYGLNKTIDFIMKERKVYVFESEKSVMQCWDYGVKNVVSIGGHNISETQIWDLENLGVEIILCFDKDVDMLEVCDVTHKTLFQKTRLRFTEDISVGYMLDTQNTLEGKESFSDKILHWDKFEEVK